MVWFASSDSTSFWFLIPGQFLPISRAILSLFFSAKSFLPSLGFIRLHFGSPARRRVRRSFRTKAEALLRREGHSTRSFLMHNAFIDGAEVCVSHTILSTRIWLQAKIRLEPPGCCIRGNRVRWSRVVRDAALSFVLQTPRGRLCGEPRQVF